MAKDKLVNVPVAVKDHASLGDSEWVCEEDTRLIHQGNMVLKSLFPKSFSWSP